MKLNLAAALVTVLMASSVTVFAEDTTPKADAQKIMHEKRASKEARKAHRMAKHAAHEDKAAAKPAQ